MRPLLSLRFLATALIALTVAACGADDGDPTVDASAGTDAATDAPAACNLPTTKITCTVGNDAPCTAVCSTAYCYNFMQLGVVCTKPCTVVGDCPSGWSCNNMGRCRPPN